MQLAAYIAATFSLDPIQILDSDYLDWQIRLQAANYYNNQRKQQQG